MAGQFSGINFSDLITFLNTQTDTVSGAITQIKDNAGKDSSVSVGAMFDLQFKMNTLSQLAEMSTSVLSASNSSIASMARNVKS